MWNVSTANERRDMDASQIPQDILDVMHNPGVYYCDMPGMGEAQTAQLEILYDFNATRPREVSRRRELLERFFAEVGEGLYIEPPLHANWGAAPIGARTAMRISTSPWWMTARSSSASTP